MTQEALAVSLVVLAAPAVAQEIDPAWDSDLAVRIAIYRTCWTVVRGIAAREYSSPSGDRWDFLLYNRSALTDMRELGCPAMGYVLPTTYAFTNHRLRPLTWSPILFDAFSADVVRYARSTPPTAPAA